MRIFGVDLGTRHIGLALCDDPDVSCRPFRVLSFSEAEAGDDRVLIDRLTEEFTKEKATEIVIGLPLRLDGSDGLSSRRARRIADELAKRTKLPVHLQDERLTTTQAQKERVSARSHRTRARAREGIDAHAAAILLQTFLDTRSTRAERT